MFSLSEFMQLNPGLKLDMDNIHHKKRAADYLRSKGYIRGWKKREGDQWAMRYWGRPEEFSPTAEAITDAVIPD